MQKSILIAFLFIFIVSCSNIQQDSDAMSKCIKLFMESKSNSTKEMPSYMKEAIARETCKALLEQDKQKTDEWDKQLYGVFVNQGITMNKDGTMFRVRIKNNESPGNFKIVIEKTEAQSGNSISLKQEKESFHLAANSEISIDVEAMPTIANSYAYAQDIFQIKITAYKNKEIFKEIETFLTVNTK